ncbi:hypothetical protein BD779DRAFT_1446556 [Infundibulicybe gibba]|nr:hypothetical protein BD779DRAFT_1446556 [Infundibulicybe gibba]
MTSTTFSNLPHRLQQRIDEAFDAALNDQAPGQSRIHQPTDSGGGFIVDHPSQGGGFIPEESGGAQGNQLLLADIPKALQFLDLPPDDDEILAVFNNAASGWSSSTSKLDQAMDGGRLVDREDFRAVCAVLLEGTAGTSEGNASDNFAHDADSDGGSSDEYHNLDESHSDIPDDESEDEYVDGPAPSHRRVRGTTTTKPSEGSKKLTSRQEQAVLEAFALFFPDIPKSDVPNQRIMIKDIQRASQVLGEKLKADEMVEMLTAFSTSPDQSMNLQDFGRMMAMARLV